MLLQVGSRLRRLPFARSTASLMRTMPTVSFTTARGGVDWLAKLTQMREFGQGD